MKIVKPRKNSIDHPKKKKLNMKNKEKYLAIIGYLILMLIFGGVVYFKVLIKKQIILQIIFVSLYVLSIFSFFIVSFSDPGRLIEEFKTTLNEKSIKSYEERAKSSESEDLEFRDDGLNDQIEIECNSNENHRRNTTNGNRGDRNKKTRRNNLSIEMSKNIIPLSKKKNFNFNIEKFGPNKELHIEIEDTSNNDDTNKRKYFTSKNKKKTKIDFADHNFQGPQVANTVNSVYNSNNIEKKKNKNERYAEIPNNSLAKQANELDGDYLSISKDIHLEEVNNNSKAKENNINKDNYSSDKEKAVESNQINIIMNETSKKTEADFSTLTIYCSTCFIDIPLRAKHCNTCNKCIATFDHHCSWIGNCIGEKNKRLFIIFLFIHVMSLGFGILIDILNFDKTLITEQWIKSNAFLFISTMLIILFFTFVLSLLVFQLQLLLVNQSTWENYSWHKINYMRKISKSQKSPFNKKFINNCSYVFRYKKYYNKKKEAYLNDHIDWVEILEDKN